MSGKPLPPVDATTQAYWDRCTAGELTVQICNDCGHQQHYPRWLCSQCHGQNLALRAVTGLGQIKSFTVIRRPVSAAFDADTPYVVALIELAEGPTLMSNVVNCDVEALAIGQPVQVCFEPRGDLQIPQFEPASG